MGSANTCHFCSSVLAETSVWDVDLAEVVISLPKSHQITKWLHQFYENFMFSWGFLGLIYTNIDLWPGLLAWNDTLPWFGFLAPQIQSMKSPWNVPTASMKVSPTRGRRCGFWCWSATFAARCTVCLLFCCVMIGRSPIGRCEEADFYMIFNSWMLKSKMIYILDTLE